MLSTIDLKQRIIQFSRKLRAEGVNTSQADTLVAIEALMHIDLLDMQAFYHTLRATFCFSPEDYRRFERVFRGFWEEVPSPAGKEQLSNDSEQTSESEEDDQEPASLAAGEQSNVELAHFQAALETNSELTPENDSGLNKIGSYSVDEQLLLKRFSVDPLFKKNKLDPELAILMYLLKKTLALDKETKGNKTIHFRRTIRKNIQFGGEEIFRLHKSGQTNKNKQLLITLADISGSMDSFLKKYLLLLYQLHEYARHTEVFFFNTDTYQVTKYFKREYHHTVEMLNEQLRMTAKGTNLAKSIKYIRKNFYHTLSREFTTILIFSDGWDRGDMEDLRRELTWLNKQVQQIIWLNPLLGSEGYEPITQALQVAKPYIDYLVSGQDYKALYLK